MASGLNEEHVEKKLMTVNNTQDSIQGLSLWIIHHKGHHSRIVDLWAKVMKKSVKPSHRLTLYYLCNDVVQNCKRKKAVVYVDTFKQHLKQITALVRDATIKPKIERIFNIWEERQVYDKEFVADLRAILDGKKADSIPVKKSHKVPKETKEVSATPPLNPADVFDEIQPPDPNLAQEKEKEAKETTEEPEIDVPTPEVLAEFKPQEMVDKIRSYKRQEGDVEVKVRQLAHLKLDASSIEAVKQLKDRAHGNEFSTQFEESCQRLEEAVKGLEKKKQEQKDLLSLLRISEYFYDEQNREARIVANAYKNFGSRINSMKRRLDELKRSLPSPVPSPSVDAPSPGNTPPHLLESNTVPVDMDLDTGEDGGHPPEAFTRPRVALTSTTSSIVKPISSIKEITFADDEIPSPPEEAPSPVSSPEDGGDSKGGSSLDNRLANFIPSLQGGKKSGKDRPIPVYVPQPLNSSGDSGRRPSANRTLTQSDMAFPEEEGGSTPLTDERPSTPVLDEGPNELAPPPPPPPPPLLEKKKKKENPMDFLSRLILSQTQSKQPTPNSSFLEGFSQLTSKAREQMEGSNSNGSTGDMSPTGTQAPKSWAAWKAQTAEKSDALGVGDTSLPPPPVPNFAMPPPPPPVPPPVLPPGLSMPPPRMPPPMSSPPRPFFQQTSPGQKENWPEVQGGGDSGEAGPSPTMLYPSVQSDVPPPPFPPVVSKAQGAPIKGILRKGGHSVLKELTRSSEDAAPSGAQLPPPPPPPPLQSPVSSAPMSVSLNQPKTLDQPPSPVMAPGLGTAGLQEAEEFMEKLKRKTMMAAAAPSSYTPNPVRPNLMTLTPGSDGDDGMGEMDMDLDDEEEEEEDVPQGPPGRPKGIPVLSSVVRRVDPSEKQLRDNDRSVDRDLGNRDHSRDTFHKDRPYGRRLSDEYYPPSGPDPSSSSYDYRDDHMYGYGPNEQPYFDPYPPARPYFNSRNPQQGFPFRPPPPKRPFIKRGGYPRRPDYRY